MGLEAQENTGLPSDVGNSLITLEAFAVTFYGAARTKAGLDLNDDVTRFVRAAQCEEDAHFHYFEAAGAVPSATTFSIPDARLKSQATFLASLLEIESILVGAYMSAARVFSGTGNGRWVEIAYQIGTVEAQHQALVKLYGGDRVPSDRAYAQWQFRHPSEAVAEIEQLGYIGGKGEKIAYPGPADRYCRGVTGLVPETTEDQPTPETTVDVTPAASPVGALG
jgi:hypothetical protein